MTITKIKNGTWTLDDRIKCSDGKYHHMKVSGYAKKKDAIDDYANQKQLFLKRFDEKNNNLIKLVA